jgi:hypothetical protein
VYFASPLRGVACGAFERILLTTDGGTTWTIRSEGTLQQYSYQSIVLEDTVNGLAIGDGGRAARTTDGGMDWVELPRPTGSNLFGLRFQGPGRAIGVGGYGTILRYTSEIPVAVASEPVASTGFRLYQNYPNPFNSSTIIQFYLDERLDISLVIYDLLGRLITTIYEGPLTGGIHSFEWHATDASSGTYLCRLRAGDYTRVTSLLLLK